MSNDVAVIQSNAIQALENHKNDLVFVSREDLQTQKMFLPEIVVIRGTQDDFHNISGKFMPKREHTDKIGEAAGIVFLEKNCGTRSEQLEGHTVYIGFAQAKKRLPDGTWRTSSVCEYEFDPVKRAEEDILRDTKGKYNTDKQKKLALLTYQKFGRARANSGARLRVIRELTGMPTAFLPTEIQKAMIFGRIAVNTDELLSDPATRHDAIQHALGARDAIYGPKDVTPEPEALPAPEQQDDEPDIFDPGPETVQPDEDEAADLKAELEKWLLTDKIKNPRNRAGIQAAIEKADATVEYLRDILVKVEKMAGGEA